MAQTRMPIFRVENLVQVLSCQLKSVSHWSDLKNFLFRAKNGLFCNILLRSRAERGQFKIKVFTSEGKSAAIFCFQVAALVPNMFCNFYLVENQKIAKNLTRIKAIEKISTDLEYLELKIFFDASMTKSKIVKFY
jgi:hypothetical protein